MHHRVCYSVGGGVVFCGCVILCSIRYTRPKDNLIRHRGDRIRYRSVTPLDVVRVNRTIFHKAFCALIL